ncbi:helix-turn-helix transcriptional regulator [Paenibacillus alba]|uniref:AraC family transcriptional regulator n=1 Tax=Paenibacillus alba TaxID=1197127 RepID=A0ABU6GHX5_9BACL|nr:AraC family transcriptional regulator [Paenibacillus alba]MEC0232318.1 AraC family transcriptional regulator [Paenibacillus alba]
MPDVTFYRDDALPFLEAKQCLKSDFAYQRHFHEEYSIGLIDEGETHAWCDGVMHRVEKGRVISFPPMMLHACYPDSGVAWKYKMLFIHPAWFQGLSQRELDQLQIPFLLGEGKNKACRIHINRTMEALARSSSPLEIETALIELIQALVSQNTSDLEHESQQGQQDQKYVKRIKDYLHAHFTERITLEQLEHVAGISKFHLIRLFKRWNHLPPHAYQNLLRINQAKTELIKKRSIAEVAIEVGFYDQSHFSKTFDKIVGTTPHKYAVSI